MRTIPLTLEQLLSAVQQLSTLLLSVGEVVSFFAVIGKQ
jgi:hypothetical protein